MLAYDAARGTWSQGPRVPFPREADAQNFSLTCASDSGHILLVDRVRGGGMRCVAVRVDGESERSWHSVGSPEAACVARGRAYVLLKRRDDGTPAVRVVDLADPAAKQEEIPAPFALLWSTARWSLWHDGVTLCTICPGLKGPLPWVYHVLDPMQVN